MKKFLLFALLLIVGTTAVLANPKAPSKEMMEEVTEFKIKFLSKEMELSKDQEQKFADAYKKMEQERRKIFCSVKAKEKALKENKNATEAEYEAVNNAFIEAKTKDAEIEKKYDNLFSQFLSKQQIFKMKSAEEKFRQKMRDMHRKKSGKNKGKTSSCLDENCPPA